jgi:hypothetical protein
MACVVRCIVRRRLTRHIAGAAYLVSRGHQLSEQPGTLDG